MARGNIAKQNIADKIKTTFGQDFIGEVDKKLYIWADDGGERVQIAISMTCPKTMIETIDTNKLSYNTGRNFESEDIVAVAPEKVEISDKEREDVRNLMQRLGL